MADKYAKYTPQSGINGEMFRYLKTLAYHGAKIRGVDGSTWQPVLYGPERSPGVKMERIDPKGGVEYDWLQWLEWNGYTLEKLRATVGTAGDAIRWI